MLSGDPSYQNTSSSFTIIIIITITIIIDIIAVDIDIVLFCLNGKYRSNNNGRLIFILTAANFGIADVLRED